MSKQEEVCAAIAYSTYITASLEEGVVADPFEELDDQDLRIWLRLFRRWRVGFKEPA